MRKYITEFNWLFLSFFVVINDTSNNLWHPRFDKMLKYYDSAVGFFSQYCVLCRCVYVFIYISAISVTS